MTENEAKLREAISSDDANEAIDSALTLVTTHLSPRGELEEAEFMLLRVLGLQTKAHNLIVELSLGELYVKMKEYSRAKRFLEIALMSSQESVTKRASEIIEEAKKISPES